MIEAALLIWVGVRCSMPPLYLILCTVVAIAKLMPCIISALNDYRRAK